MQKRTYNNMIVVSGTGRNTGKTTFVCKLISKLEHLNCVAVKISSHFHELPAETKFIQNTKNFQIIVEKDETGSKDSQKMLNAGADRVYYIQAKDEFLPDVMNYLELNEQQPFIFESGAIAKFIPDAIHVCISGDEKYKPCRQPDYNINQQDDNIDSFLESIQFFNNKFIVNA